MRNALIVAPLILAIVAVACASSRDSSTGWVYRRAEQSYAEGDLEKALEYSEKQLFQDGIFSTSEHLSLHYTLLQELDRREALRALQRFVVWYDSGEDTSAVPDTPSEKECEESNRARRKKTSGSLIKDSVRPRRRELPYRYDRKPWVLTFELVRDGSRENIQVKRAANPAVAWYLIDSIETSDLHVRRLQKVNETDFPLSYCSWKPAAGLNSVGGVGRGSGR